MDGIGDPQRSQRRFARALATALAATAGAMLIVVPSAHAQAIDEPGVHLVDPDYSGPDATTARVSAPVAPSPDSRACTSGPRQTADASADGCVAPTGAVVRERKPESGERSGRDMVTPVRTPRVPAPAAAKRSR